MDEPQDVTLIGEWIVRRSSGELICGIVVERVEPKSMELLLLLASRPGASFTKDQIMEALWPGVIVGDDTLARTVSRLRKALGDDARAPRYIETLHKRGYRLIATVSQVVEPPAAAAREPMPRQGGWAGYLRMIASSAVVASLVIAVLVGLRLSPEPAALASPRALSERATDFYFQYTRADNEAAIELFQRISVDYPDYAPALAGLANALVQKVVRWPDTPGAVSYKKLGDALRGGATRTPEAQRLLARAEQLSVRAAELAPNDPGVLKALGLVRSGQGRFDDAIKAYQAAVTADPDAWGALINIGDVLEVSGRLQAALPYFEAAYAAMTRVYDQQSARVRPWHAELGVLIGDRYHDRGDASQSIAWYRRVLATAPLNVEATTHLALVLRQTGDAGGAVALCRDLAAHLKTAGCGS